MNVPNMEKLITLFFLLSSGIWAVIDNGVLI